MQLINNMGEKNKSFLKEACAIEKEFWKWVLGNVTIIMWLFFFFEANGLNELLAKIFIFLYLKNLETIF